MMLEMIVDRRVSSCDHRSELVSKTKLVELVVLKRNVGLRNDPLEVIGVGRVVVHDLERDEVRSSLAVVDLRRVEGLESRHRSVTPVKPKETRESGQHRGGNQRRTRERTVA